MEWLLLFLVGGFLGALFWAYAHQTPPAAKAAKNGVTFSPEAATRGLWHRAHSLTLAYARVLERAKGGVLRPESQLPASKEAIKAALLLCALSTVSKAKRPPDTARLHHYQVSYGFLAHFVADEIPEKQPVECAGVSTRDDSARHVIDPCAVGQKITDAATLRQAGALSPVEFLRLGEEFAQRLDALTDRERGRAESLRIRTALLGS